MSSSFASILFSSRGRDYRLTRRIMLRSLAVIYGIAFVSLWVQVDGLIGTRGIWPVDRVLPALAKQLGAERWLAVPTLCWISSSDGFLHFLCAGGVALSLLACLGLAPGATFFLLWLSYLSLVNTGGQFLQFQWDSFLLETGFLAIFLAPWTLLSGPSRDPPPSAVSLWLVRWLLFRMMFSSGIVKLTSLDVTWADFTALDFHYYTQPLPTWIGWYAHQLPDWFQKTSIAIMYAIELGVPFLIFVPGLGRLAAFLPLVALQVLILLTGNYCFFNLLTIVLCLSLAHDGWWGGWWSHLKRRRRSSSPAAARPAPTARDPLAKTILTWALVALVALLSAIELANIFARRHVPQIAWEAYRRAAPFHVVNGYGLFRVMTTTRPEIIVEGSEDGATWLAYEFKWKPGDLNRRPAFVEPHQPRLDWQMWFAALGSPRQNAWFINFMVRLLEGSPPVLGLLEKNPFPAKPPRYVRALLYNYEFTDPATLRSTGAWWRREPQGFYCRTLSLPARS